MQAVQAVQTAAQEITPEQEYYIGRAVAANILTTSKVWNDQKATTYLNVLERALSLYSDRPETFGGYHLLIMDTDEINAFSAPGGLILVSRGLLRCATKRGHGGGDPRARDQPRRAEARPEGHQHRPVDRRRAGPA